MPPEEQERNSNVSCIIKLFKEANEQCDIEPPDTSLLVSWLDACTSKRLAREVEKFSHEEEFRKECKCKPLVVALRRYTVNKLATGL